MPHVQSLYHSGGNPRNASNNPISMAPIASPFGRVRETKPTIPRATASTEEIKARTNAIRIATTIS